MGRHDRARAPPAGNENTHQNLTPRGQRRRAQLRLRPATPRIKTIEQPAGIPAWANWERKTVPAQNTH
jgi:hypothetical protein